MRILLYTPNYLPATRYGGPIRSVHGLARALVRMGHEVTVFTTDADGPGVLDVPKSRPVMLDGVEVRYFPTAHPKKIYFSPAMGRALAREVGSFDVVHVNGVFLWPGIKAGAAAQRACVPLVLSPRGMLVDELIEARSSLPKRLWIAAFERRNIGRAAAIHVTSQVEAEELEKLGLPLGEVVLIPNGVDAPEPSPTLEAEEDIWKGAPKGQRIAFAARLDWKKGVDLAVEVALANPDSHLRLAGPDEGGMRAPLEQRIRERGAAERIRFLGELADREKWAFLAGADLTLVPSLNENFGNVVIESMAMGTPVVCTDGVGASSLVRRIDPRLISHRSPEALTSIVAELLGDRRRREELGKQGQELVEVEFTWLAIGGRMLALYDRVCRSVSGAPLVEAQKLANSSLQVRP